MKTRTFYYSRTYATLLLVFCSAIVIGGVTYFLTGETYHSRIWIFYLMIYPAVQFPLIWRVFINAMFNRPALVLSPQHITITQLGYEILWGDIEHFKSKQRGGNNRLLVIVNSHYIAFDLYDPMEYIRKTPNLFTRILRRIHLSFFDGPFCLGLDVIDGENKEILDAIREYYRDYARHPLIEI